MLHHQQLPTLERDRCEAGQGLYKGNMITLLCRINVSFCNPVEQAQYTNHLFLTITQRQCNQGKRRFPKQFRQCIKLTRLPCRQANDTTVFLVQRFNKSLRGTHGQTGQRLH